MIPSRDEPFGLVAVEFGRKGALGVGARVGGLGQMVSVYSWSRLGKLLTHLAWLVVYCRKYNDLSYAATIQSGYRRGA